MSPKVLSKLSRAQSALRVTSQTFAIFWRTDKKAFIGLSVTTILPGVLPFVNIYIYQLIIDYVVHGIQHNTLSLEGLYPLFILRAASYFAFEAASTGQGYFLRVLSYRLPMEINLIALRKITELDSQYFEKDDFRDLLEKVRDASMSRPTDLVMNALFSITSIVGVAIALVALIKLNFLFIFPIAAVSIPAFLNQAKRSSVAWGIWNQSVPERKKFFYLRNLIQSPRSNKEIKTLTLGGEFLSEVKSVYHKFFRENELLARRFTLFSWITDFLATASFVGIEAYVVYQAFRGAISIGSITFYTGVVSNFQSNLSGLFRTLNRVFEHSLYLESVFELLALDPIIQNSPSPIVLKSSRPPKIEFKNVSFRYPQSENKILDDFSLTINPGDKIALVGENGAGKTTLIKLLARFYDPDSGEILIDGTNLKDLDLEKWYSYLGILFQDFNKYDHTAFDNIRFGRLEDHPTDQKVHAAAKLGGADQLISKYEDKYQQMLGTTFKGGIDLSGGQWQKIALSRAFFRNAPILILDEPTAAIDAKAEAEIFERVQHLSKDKSVIIISHRFSTVRMADKIYVIENGKIVESGDHTSLMKKEGLYADLFHLQAKGYQ